MQFHILVHKHQEHKTSTTKSSQDWSFYKSAGILKAIWIAPSLCNSSSADLTVVHSASLEERYNENPFGPRQFKQKCSPISEVSRKPAKNTAPGTYASTKVRVLEGLCHMPIYARCALWVLSMRWRLACHKIAVYTKQLSHQKTFTPETVSLHQTVLNSKWFPNESILQNHKEARQVLPSGRPRALPSGRPSATSLLPMPFPPPAKARKHLKKTRRKCAKKNTVINWKITTTEAIKWRRAKYEKTKHRNQQNGMNEGQAPKKTQEQKTLAATPGKARQWLRNKKEMTPEKTQEKV